MLYLAISVIGNTILSCKHFFSSSEVTHSNRWFGPHAFFRVTLLQLLLFWLFSHSSSDGGSEGSGGFSGGGGGFGGGGAANAHPGGGGGGYNGGNAAFNWDTPNGKGGGSINRGTNQTNTAGNNTGHGKVIITKL